MTHGEMGEGLYIYKNLHIVTLFLVQSPYYDYTLNPNICHMREP